MPEFFEENDMKIVVVRAPKVLVPLLKKLFSMEK